MKRHILLVALFLSFSSLFAQTGEWVELFNGQNLDGWKLSENPESFQVEDGVIKVAGPRAHAFYVGEVSDAMFEDFELLVEVKTMPRANSGIFIHTEFQENGWPNKGYEIQVNQSHKDWRKTGSVYSFQDVRETFVKDGEWYTQHVTVRGDQITVKVNGEVINEYDESDVRSGDLGDKKLSSGTIALQAHDPESVIYYRSIKIKSLD
ncbi:3-keto-disaccharide hydrolase [Algoriphagus namhaensis]